MKSFIFNKFRLIIFSTVTIIILLICLNNKSRILYKFADNLYEYPLPSNTVIVEKSRFGGENWVDGGGSDGYWNVVASMKLSTKLNREDILNYYKNIKFPFPKSNKPGVELEIYFDDDMKKELYNEGFYYRNNGGIVKEINSYFKENGEINDIEKRENNGYKLTYVIQIVSGYNSFKID